MVARVQGPFATSAVEGTRFTDVRWVAETGSTNRDLLAEAVRGRSRGHRPRRRSPDRRDGEDSTDRGPRRPGASLLVSVLLRPRIEPGDAFLVTAAAAVAAAEACSQVAAVFPGIKWPNDLMIVAGERFVGPQAGGHPRRVGGGRRPHRRRRARHGPQRELARGAARPSWPRRRSPSTTSSAIRSTARRCSSRG